MFLFEHVEGHIKKTENGFRHDYPLSLHPFSAEVDYGRQILTFKVDPRTERIKLFIMTVDP